jgi:hypothetical protein
MLTPKEELTLMQYNDGELGLWGRLFIKGLLNRPESKDFIDGLRKLRLDMVSEGKARKAQTAKSGSLWERIETRIDQEERAALYLGKRRFVGSERSSWIGAWQFAGGAVAAAGLMFVVVGLNRDGGIGAAQFTGGQVAYPTREISGVRPVSLGGPVRNSRPLQVEWMKSAGRVNFIESDDNDDLAIMWISKERIPSIDAETFSAPLSRANPETPVLINERLPRDVPVFAPKEEQ